MERNRRLLGKSTEMKTAFKSFQNEESLLGHKTTSRHQLLKYEPALVWPAQSGRTRKAFRILHRFSWPHQSYRNKQLTCMKGSQPAAQECVCVHTHGSCKDTSTEICTHSWALRIWNINTNGLSSNQLLHRGHLRTSDKCYQINQVEPDKVRKDKDRFQTQGHSPSDIHSEMHPGP